MSKMRTTRAKKAARTEKPLLTISGVPKAAAQFKSVWPTPSMKLTSNPTTRACNGTTYRRDYDVIRLLPREEMCLGIQLIRVQVNTEDDSQHPKTGHDANNSNWIPCKRHSGQCQCSYNMANPIKPQIEQTLTHTAKQKSWYLPPPRETGLNSLKNM